MVGNYSLDYIPISYIYALIDPRTDEIRYIGKANDPKKRLVSHLRDANRRRTPVYSWILSLRKLNLVPEIRVLRLTTDWKTAEREEITKARATGIRLLNLADGGDQPECSLKTRQENGRKVATARPKYIHLCLVLLGQAARGSKYNLPHAGCAYALERMKLAIDRHRKEGTLHLLDAKIGASKMMQHYAL
jgi:GIY-YIG catalytic domain